MLTSTEIGLLFIALALLFFGLAAWDYLRMKDKKTPARRAWVRIGIVFAIIGILLYLHVIGA